MKIRAYIETVVNVAYIFAEFPTESSDFTNNEKKVLSRILKSYKDGSSRYAFLINIDSGKISNWKYSKIFRFSLPTACNGIYSLLDSNKRVIETLRKRYIRPHVLPCNNHHFDFIIGTDGTILNWTKRPTISEFFINEACEYLE